MTLFSLHPLLLACHEILCKDLPWFDIVIIYFLYHHYCVESDEVWSCMLSLKNVQVHFEIFNIWNNVHEFLSDLTLRNGDLFAYLHISIGNRRHHDQHIKLAEHLKRTIPINQILNSIPFSIFFHLFANVLSSLPSYLHSFQRFFSSPMHWKWKTKTTKEAKESMQSTGIDRTTVGLKRWLINQYAMTALEGKDYMNERPSLLQIISISTSLFFKSKYLPPFSPFNIANLPQFNAFWLSLRMQSGFLAYKTRTIRSFSHKSSVVDLFSLL